MKIKVAKLFMTVKMNKKILITGVGGSGGSYLAEHIFKKEKRTKIFGIYRSLGYVPFLKKKYKSKIIFFKCDLLNFRKLKKILKKLKPNIIFHLASNADVRKSFDDPQKFNENNSLTLNILEAVRKVSPKTLVLICSSSEVYGSVEKKKQPIDESFPISPINPYAATKAYQDIISQVYQKAYNLKIIITRMFSYSNTRRDNLFQSAFAKQIVNLEKRKRNGILHHGNLKSVRTMLDVEDAMEAYRICALKGKIGEIYNIGGDYTISIYSYLKRMLKKSKIKIKLKKSKKLFRPSDVSFQIPNSTKFRKETGWRPKISLDESILKVLQDYRNSIL